MMPPLRRLSTYAESVSTVRPLNPLVGVDQRSTRGKLCAYLPHLPMLFCLTLSQVCNKCGLYERTHNKPRPHQFGLRPGNKARKQQQPTHSQHSHSYPGKMHCAPSPTSSPKRHSHAVKKEPLDYSQAMRRGMSSCLPLVRAFSSQCTPAT
jgi:hypothetical protein